MRKAALYGLAVICVCMLFALSGPSAQRIVNGDGGGSTSTSPVAVSVANFPTVQTVQVQKPISVIGSVAVTNFPAVQEVAGTVSVGNLPVDADGNVRVAGATTTHRSSFPKIADGVLFTQDKQIAVTSPLDGWKRYAVYIRGTCVLDMPSGIDYENYYFTPLVGGDTVHIYQFGVVASGGGICRAAGDTFVSLMTAEVIGPEVQIQVSGNGDAISGGPPPPTPQWCREFRGVALSHGLG
jgi:hypothetical protein